MNTLVPVVHNALFFSRAPYGANRAVSETKTIGKWTSLSCYSTGVFLKASRGEKWLIPRG